MKLFTDNINIMFELERMYIQFMDSAKVSVFEIDIPKTWFAEYNVDNAVTIGINSTIIYRVLASREKNQHVRLEFGNSENMNIHFTGDEKLTYEKHFEIPTIDLECDIMSIPSIEYQAEFSISSIQFSNMIHQLKMFGDSMDITCSEENIIMSSTTPEQGKMIVEIKIDDLTSFSIDEGETLELSYSLVYLHNICLYNKMAKEIDIKLCRNYPIKLIYILSHTSIADDNTVPKITFYLAPKVSDD
jgi:proliferating cell nuclear antigen